MTRTATHAGYAWQPPVKDGRIMYRGWLSARPSAAVMDGDNREQSLGGFPARVAAMEWETDQFVNAHIGKTYQARLPIAERALELCREHLDFDAICARLEVQFGKSRADIMHIVQWMGVDEDMRRAHHGLLSPRRRHVHAHVAA